MEAKLGLNGYRCDRKVFAKTVTQTQSQECVVPDTLPDIDAILCTSGNVLIRSKDVAEGHVRLEANIPARVYCAGENGTDRFCLDVNIPFYISAEDEAVTDGAVCTAELTLKHLETRMLNPRKITVRAEIGAQLSCYAETLQEFSTAPETPDGAIHVLEKETELTEVGCVTEKTFVLTDEFELPEDQSPAAEIVSQNAEITVEELRSVGSKLIMKGSVCSELICVSESGEPEAVTFQTSFSQIVETQTETEDALFDVRMLLSGMYYEPTPVSDGKRISMELHLVAQAVVYQKYTVRYLADAYSNAYALQLQTQQREIVLLSREAVIRDSFTAAVETAGEVRSVISCTAAPIGWSYTDGEVHIQLRVVLCWRGADGIMSAERMLTVHSAQDAYDETLKLCTVSVQDLHAAPGNGGAELRIGVEIRAFAACETTLEYVASITYDENAPLDQDDKPTVMILYPGAAVSLWETAKEHCSTVEAIRAANGLEADDTIAERMLLIPKTL